MQYRLSWMRQWEEVGDGLLIRPRGEIDQDRVERWLERFAWRMQTRIGLQLCLDLRIVDRVSEPAWRLLEHRLCGMDEPVGAVQVDILGWQIIPSHYLTTLFRAGHCAYLNGHGLTLCWGQDAR